MRDAFPTAQCCFAKEQHACVTAITPLKIWSSYRCAVTQRQCTATLVWVRCIPHYSVLLCKRGSQHACVTTNTPLKVCSSYKSAVPQHQCSAALLRINGSLAISLPCMPIRDFTLSRIVSPPACACCISSCPQILRSTGVVAHNCKALVLHHCTPI